jgi:hypothetical protein
VTPLDAGPGRGRGPLPPRPWRVHCHAIVSADDMIAAADGSMPQGLRNEADWARFQAALDEAGLVVTGRLGHEAHPNKPHRRRLVLTSRAAGMERQRDAAGQASNQGQVFLLHPAKMPLEAALDALLPVGGLVAVTGGTRVFEAFLRFGVDEFHLARATRCRIPDGRPLLPGLGPQRGATEALAGYGLLPRAAETLDAAAGVTLTVFARAQPR